MRAVPKPELSDHESNRKELVERFLVVRKASVDICEPLAVEDYQIQSIVETSPPKWHLAHVTWFFEAFLLNEFVADYQPVNSEYNYLFNSYYQTVGNMHPRAERGLLSRPTVEEVLLYRSVVEDRIIELINTCDDAQWEDIAFRIALGLNHEQQHQELLFMDIKYNFWSHPLRPTYLPRPHSPSLKEQSLPVWEYREGGLYEIGFDGSGFAFDNERPRHKVWLEPHRLRDQLVSNEEYLAFIEDGGYMRPELWLADGWQHTQQHQWMMPLYWEKGDGGWSEFTLHGLEPLNPAAPVAHVSFYEADAFARWAGKRLPTEAEIETKLSELPIEGQFSDSGILHPECRSGQWYGGLWGWTASPYIAYPGFKPLAGSMGEYNGKFMCNQQVLRGGACVTPTDHIRPTYRNFFYPHDRWQFSGIRLAEDA